MDDSENTAATLARTYLAREANKEERHAMMSEMARDARWIAPHAYGSDGGLFDVDPAAFQGRMNAEIGK